MSTYFQFPLCALAYGNTTNERLNAIISYGMIETGKVFWAKFSEQKRSEALNRWPVRQKMPNGFAAHNALHTAAMCGAEIIGITIYTLADSLERYKRLQDFIGHFESCHGKDVRVRLKKDFLFEARDGNGITPLELTVLAAIYSIIGDKQNPVRITRERIRQRALGYKSKVVFEAELSGRTDKAQPLSEWKLRDTVDRLHARKFFCRCTYGRRQTYYSHRMTETAFRETLLNMKTHRDLFKMEQRHADNGLTDAIRNQRAAMQGKPPPRPNAMPLVLNAVEFEP